MATGIKHTGENGFESIREKYNIEQVLGYFKIAINERNKCLCPFHNDTDPSLQVNEKHVYCFGCKQSWDIFSLAKALLEKQNNRSYSVAETFHWFATTPLPEKTERLYPKSTYEGAVNPDLINYWHDRLTEEQYQQLYTERLITKETIDRYLLGWRPDWKAWSIPFIMSDGTVDIVQFRMTEEDASSKYLGLKGHNRGSVMNAYLLDEPQEYLIVLFGAFDAILAAQDDLLAVGLNGSTPFKRTEKTRVQAMFSKQKTIYIVPDNSPSEYGPAQKLVDWIGGEVCYFPVDLPEGTDYVDYRKLGYTAEDFLYSVLDRPLPANNAVLNVVELLRAGDPFALSTFHAATATGVIAKEFAVAIASQLKDDKLKNIRQNLLQIKTSEELYNVLQSVAYTTQGGW